MFDTYVKSRKTNTTIKHLQLSAPSTPGYNPRLPFGSCPNRSWCNGSGVRGWYRPQSLRGFRQERPDGTKDRP